MESQRPIDRPALLGVLSRVFPSLQAVFVENDYRLVGTAAGELILATEDHRLCVEINENTHVDFCLRVKGDSMIDARINDGDIVFVRKQPCVENGEIAVVLIDDEVTLKRFYKNNGG